MRPKSLEQRTQLFWLVSRSWHGHGRKLTTEQALKLTCDIAMSTNPAKPLARKVLEIEHQIVVGGRRKKPKDPSQLLHKVVNLNAITTAQD